MKLGFLILILFLLPIINLEAGNKALWSDRVFKSYERQVAKEKGWKISSKGYDYRGSTPTNEFIFVCDQQVTLEEARRLYVEQTQKLMNKFNSRKIKSSNLNRGSFSIEDMAFCLSFRNTIPGHYPPPYIALVIPVNDKIIYEVLDPNTDKFETVHKESYAEAVRIVQEENHCGYGDF